MHHWATPKYLQYASIAHNSLELFQLIKFMTYDLQGCESVCEKKSEMPDRCALQCIQTAFKS